MYHNFMTAIMIINKGTLSFFNPLNITCLVSAAQSKEWDQVKEGDVNCQTRCNCIFSRSAGGHEILL